MAYHDDEEKEGGDLLGEAVDEETDTDEDEEEPDLGDTEEEKGWE